MTKFDEYVSQLPALYARLEPIENPTYRENKGKKGVYVFVDGNRRVYVGNTRNLQQRIRQHGSRSVNGASFAIKLLRKELNQPASYKPDSSAKTLVKDNLELFDKQRARIKAMKVLFVEVDDPVLRHLLEVYIHLEAGLPAKGFETS